MQQSDHDTDISSSGRSLWGQTLFLAVAVGFWVFFRNRPFFRTFAITFVSIVLEAFPFMLVGALVGGFIDGFVSREKLARWLPKRRWLAVFAGAGLGMFFPVCECAIVPVVRRLLQKGLPLGTAVAFLLGGPIVNPIVAVSTAVAYSFKWSLVMERLLFGYAIAVAIGLLMDVFFKGKQAVLNDIIASREGSHVRCHGADPAPENFSRKIRHSLQHAAHDFFDITRFLIMGAFVAGLMQAVVSRQAIAPLFSAPVMSILFMMVLALLLNLCSEADAFVAASFRTTGMPLSAQMAFMVLGPMLDIKLMLMYVRVFRTRTILILSSLTFLAVFFLMCLREAMGW
jgi:uncharacterized protein